MMIVEFMFSMSIDVYFMLYSVKCYVCQAQILICEINYASVLTKR